MVMELKDPSDSATANYLIEHPKFLRSQLLDGYVDGMKQLGRRGYDFQVPTPPTPSQVLYNYPDGLKQIGFVAAYSHLNNAEFERRDAQKGLDVYLGQLPQELGSAITQQLDNCSRTVDYVNDLSPELALRTYTNWMFRHFHGGLNLIMQAYREQLEGVPYPRTPHYQPTDKRGFARLAEVEEKISHMSEPSPS